MTATVIPIDGGGALWVRRDLGLVMVVDPDRSPALHGMRPDDFPVYPRQFLPACQIAQTDPVLLEKDLDLQGRTVRLRVRAAPLVNGLLRRLQHLTGTGGVTPTEELDLCTAQGGYQGSHNGNPLFSTDSAREAVGLTCMALLDLAVKPSSTVLFVHAACLIDAGSPILMSAPSGGGKTTLSLALAADGASLLTDDTVAIVAEDFSLAGLPIPLRVRPEGWPLVRDLLSAEATAAAEPNHRGIRLVPPALAGKTQGKAPPAAAAIILDRQCSPGMSWFRLSPTEGFTALINGGASLPLRFDPDCGSLLARWCARTPFYCLRYQTLAEGVAGFHGIRKALAQGQPDPGTCRFVASSPVHG